MRVHNSIFLVLTVLVISCAWAQQSKTTGILSGEELKKIAPTGFFYRGQSASTQLRNSAGIRTPDDKYVLAGLVDTAGYASNIAERYQGFFITEIKVKIEGSELVPGEYGLGFVGEKFVITDVGANEVLSVSSQRDDNLKRALPLNMAKQGDGYRLYAGKMYVTLKVE